MPKTGTLERTQLERDTTDWQAELALTNNCQIDGEISRRCCSEVHPAAVDTLVVQLYPIQG